MQVSNLNESQIEMTDLQAYDTHIYLCTDKVWWHCHVPVECINLINRQQVFTFR